MLLVRKVKGPEWLRGKWNGVGGKVEGAESQIQCAVRELREETGIMVEKDDLVMIEHQYFPSGRYQQDHVWWYALRSPFLGLPANGANDVGEPLSWWPVDYALGEFFVDKLCPNIEYLIPKARVMLRTHYLDRPWG